MSRPPYHELIARVPFNWGDATLVVVQILLLATCVALNQVVTTLMQWFEWPQIRVGAQVLSLLSLGTGIALFVLAKDRTVRLRQIASKLLGVVAMAAAVAYNRTPVTGILEGSVARVLAYEGASEVMRRGYSQLVASTDFDGYISVAVAKEDLPKDLEQVLSRLGFGRYTLRAIDIGDGQMYLRISYPLDLQVSLFYYLGSPDSLENKVKSNPTMKKVWDHLYAEPIAGM